MTGTFINVTAVIVGSLIGLCLKKGIKKEYEQGINKSLGLAICVIGLNGIIANMFSAKNGAMTSHGELLLVVYLVLGTLVGEMLRIEEKLGSIGDFLEKKFKMTQFSQGYVNASLLFCIGAMSIIGSLNDGLLGDSGVLIIKSALDFTAAIILSASMGIGVLFSFVPVLIYQGSITLAAGTLSGVLQGELLVEICTVGYAIILAIGINFLSPKKFKTANMLPCLIIPCVYHFTLWVYCIAIG